MVRATAAIDAAQRVPGWYVLQRHIASPACFLPIGALSWALPKHTCTFTCWQVCRSWTLGELNDHNGPLRDYDSDCEGSHTLYTRLITSRAPNTPSRCSSRSFPHQPVGLLILSFLWGRGHILQEPLSTPPFSTVPSDIRVERFSRLMPNMAQSRQ